MVFRFLVLHAYSGYDYTEIAAMLELSVDNVRMRAMRGRAHLGRIMSALMAVEEERMRQDEVTGINGRQEHAAYTSREEQ